MGATAGSQGGELGRTESNQLSCLLRDDQGEADRVERLGSLLGNLRIGRRVKGLHQAPIRIHDLVAGQRA